MAILIANIGTSDLSIKLDDFYIPIGFDRNEPNIDDKNLTPDELAAWGLRQDIIVETLYHQLNLPTENRFSFRDLTCKLLEAYKQDGKIWHAKIRPGRIEGILRASQQPKFAVQKVYIFVTDQPPEEKQGHPTDSIHLFELLKLWASQEIPGLDLIQRTIKTPPNVQDGLLDYYYQFFSEIDRTETILVSIKGGTPQMQNALRIQAIAADLPQLLFIDPQLSVKKILAGEVSDCKLTSYWRYQRTQKYQTVKQLLERWDFGGAIAVLKSWHKLLSFLINQDVLNKPSVADSRLKVDAAIDCLKYADCLFNLDLKTAKEVAYKYDDLNLQVGDYKVLLNLYTQCLIYNRLEQIANFLSRLSSFCDGVLEQLIKSLGGEEFLDSRQGGPSSLKMDLMKSELGETIYEDFKKRARLNHSSSSSPPKLSNRDIKEKFVSALIDHRCQSFGKLHKTDKTSWEQLQSLLRKLEYWIHRRNDLIHGSQGISQSRIQELNQKRPRGACEFKEILDILSEILQNPLIKLEEEYKQFLSSSEYYLYSHSCSKAIAILNQDRA